MTLDIVRDIAALRARLGAERRVGRTIGFVPTMGALHEGHLSLVRRARERCDVVVVSVFVNPTQFNDPADLERYPRDEATDARLLGQGGADVLFAPSIATIYPPGFSTVVEVAGLTEMLEGEVRGPSHFRGVTTVVSKLFNIVQPDVAFFGQKDAQQALVVRRMVRDLDIPVEIVVAPTVREADGLAMSSRNALLDPESRARAVALYRGLLAAAAAVAAGTLEARAIVGAAAAEMESRGVFPEYAALVSMDTLQPLLAMHDEALLAVAAKVGGVRLIDNAILRVPA